MTQESLKPCLATLRILMDSSLSPDFLRSLALSITYCLHKPTPAASLQRKKSLRFAPAASRPAASKSEKYTPGPTLGLEMLRVYASVLCNPHDLVPLRKFAKAVTNKVGSIHEIPRKHV